MNLLTRRSAITTCFLLGVVSLGLAFLLLNSFSSLDLRLIHVPFGASHHDSQSALTRTHSTPTVSSTVTTTATVTSSTTSESVEPSWTFDALRDSNNHGLSSSQCNIAFGPLFSELDRAANYRQNLGKVTSDDIDISWKHTGAIRALIYDRHLYVLETTKLDAGYDRPRALAILHAINRAMKASLESIPNIEFSFTVSDIADHSHLNRTIWALTRLHKEEEKWLMSDFGYWSWPLNLLGSYDQIRQEIRLKEPAWKDKIDKVVWRGAAKTNVLRKSLLAVTKGKSWSDVKEVFWKNSETLASGSQNLALSMPEHCKYRYLVQTEGNSYSGRGKYLQNCQSVFIMHKRKWVEPHHIAMVADGPDQNYVEVERDFSDLEHKMLELLIDPEKSKGIANRSTQIFRDLYLTPAAQTCYWRYMIRAWESVSFVPEGPWREADGSMKLRGIPFETFVVATPQPECSLLQKFFRQCNAS